MFCSQVMSGTAKTDDDEYQRYQQSYYSIAHSKREIITEQATIMVNGKLKQYQVSNLFHLEVQVIWFIVCPLKENLALHC